jgi:hypothetical protein
MRLSRHILEARWAIFARYLSRSSKPILLGPWRSEVGFELLYWIPFLTHFREKFQIPKDRLVYLGRGGSAQWFDSAGKADLFEYLPLEAVRGLTVQASQQTGSIKQHSTPEWERHVCALAATSMGLKDYHVLSPSWMYQLLGPFWHGSKPLSWLDDRTLHPVRLKAPALSHGIQLPKDYIAMRWYARATWPLREDLVLWTRRFVEAIASRMPVVMIQSGFQTDDHADINLGGIPNVFNLKYFTTQAHTDNLAIQSAVIANAKGYVGTYGGMAQGAMRWGVPTLALYHEFGQTAPAHLHLTQSLSLKSGVPFVATYPQSLEALMPLIPLKDKQLVANA